MEEREESGCIEKKELPWRDTLAEGVYKRSLELACPGLAVARTKIVTIKAE
jgi:hypothetical protein